MEATKGLHNALKLTPLALESTIRERTADIQQANNDTAKAKSAISNFQSTLSTLETTIFDANTTLSNVKSETAVEQQTLGRLRSDHQHLVDENNKLQKHKAQLETANSEENQISLGWYSIILLNLNFDDPTLTMAGGLYVRNGRNFKGKKGVGVRVVSACLCFLLLLLVSRPACLFAFLFLFLPCHVST
jgi:hypothetical protein